MLPCARRKQLDRLAIPTQCKPIGDSQARKNKNYLIEEHTVRERAKKREGDMVSDRQKKEKLCGINAL